MPGMVPKSGTLKRLNNQSNDVGGISFDPAIVSKIQPGVEVEHNRFGRGKVLSIEGNGASKKAAVFFQKVGQKQLLLKYAKLKILD
jgi:DNA helicase-2/ATP-dependent DNA helicase PcrA